jgi:hypothetical protein
MEIDCPYAWINLNKHKNLNEAILYLVTSRWLDREKIHPLTSSMYLAKLVCGFNHLEKY